MYATCPSCHRPYASKAKGSLVLVFYAVAVLLLFIPAAITRDREWGLLILAGMCGFVPMSLLFQLPTTVLVRYEDEQEMRLESQFRADLRPLVKPGRKSKPRFLDGEVLALQPDSMDGGPAPDRPHGKEQGSDAGVYPCIIQHFRAEKDGVRNVGLVFLHREEIPSHHLEMGQTFSLIRHGRPVAKITLLSHLEETD